MIKNYSPFKFSFKSFFILIIFARSLSSELYAQTFASLSEIPANGSIKGAVLSTDGNPVAFVNIMVKGTNKGGIPAEDGTYQIRNVKAGTYTLVATYIGLQAQEKEISVSGEQTSYLYFTLPRSTQQLSEVTVTETRSFNSMQCRLEQQGGPNANGLALDSVSGFVTFDLSMGYAYKNLSLLGKLANITNELNYLVHENYSVNPIPPRQLVTTLSFKF